MGLKKNSQYSKDQPVGVQGKIKSVKELLLSFYTTLTFTTATKQFVSTGTLSQKTLPKVFFEPPMIVFRQPDSLRNLLVGAEIFKPSQTLVGTKGVNVPNEYNIRHYSPATVMKKTLQNIV